MRPQIMGITVTKEQIMAIVEDWLNTDVFCLCPHRITDIDLYTDDDARQLVFLDLEPLPPAVVEDVQLLRAGPEADPITFVEPDPILPAVPVTIQTERLIVATYDTNGTNGNGHHEPIEGGGGKQEAQAGASETPAASKKGRRIPDEMRAYALQLADNGVAVKEIIQRTGISHATIYAILADERRKRELDPECAELE